MGTRGSGMGSPFEEDFYYEGFRDFGSNEPVHAKDVIYDPKTNPSNMPPPQRVKIVDPKYDGNPVFTKEPAFISPPFFSRPKIKLARVTIPAAGSVGAPNTTILDWTVEDRQHWIMTSIGMDTDNPTASTNGLAVFRFTVNGVIYQLWDDQTRAIPDPPGPPDAGETTRVPGTVASPFDMRGAGLVFGVNGRANILFTCRNSNPVLPANDIIVTTQITFYEYWMPNNSEFETGQWQW